jgi:D-sedoheptulose 7-phosphate isomerase
VLEYCQLGPASPDAFLGVRLLMNFPERYKADITSAVESIDSDEVMQVIELFKQTRTAGRNIYVCASTSGGRSASKVVCDLMTRSSFNQPVRFRVLGLSGTLADLDADRKNIASDSVFVEQLKNFVETGDVVVGISASGNSSPIIRAIEYASQIGCRTVALTGLDGGRLAAIADLTVHVDSTHLGTVEDAHLVICHMIGSYFLEAERV